MTDISTADLVEYLEAEGLDYRAPDFNLAGHSPVVLRSRAERIERWGGAGDHSHTRNRRRRAHGRPRGR